MTIGQTTPSAGFDRRAIPPGAVESRWEAGDGHRIRRLDLAAPEGAASGSILYMPGRGDFYEKYLETLDHWRARGWCVTAADWRGQALSGRLGADERTGHVDDFGLWVEDLGTFWRGWKAHRPGPHVLAGHSMGGHLVLRAVAEGAVDPDAVILSTPMLGLRPGFMPSWLLHGFARLMAWAGDVRRPAFRAGEKPTHPVALRSELLTHDKDRYDDERWWTGERPDLALGPPSWGWIERALASIRLIERRGTLEAIEQPVLIIATTADKLVAYSAIEKAARRIARARLVSFGREARHEILREADPVRDKALAQIDRFLDEVAQRNGS